MSSPIPLDPIPRASQDSHSTDRDRDHERPPSINEDLPPHYEPPKEQTQMELHRRSIQALILALFYAALVLAPWVIICTRGDRPIITDRYGTVTGYYRDYLYKYDDAKSPYRKNERWYRAARIIQVIASVLTLPLISAICARAAVIFMQRQQNLTMPQLMTLADRGWMDLATYRRICLRQWRHYGSPFLLFALLVSLLGLIISPIQSIFLTTQAVKVPTEHQRVSSLWDLLTYIQTTTASSSEDNNLATIMTRAALTTTTTDELHSQLWPGANVSCDPSTYEYTYRLDVCSRKGATFENISEYPDPFLAQLPANFHTGLLRQFLPRINSTAQVQSISEAEFPENCDTLPGAFFVEYTNTTQYSNTIQTWGLKACMPANVMQSPWKATRDRHDFVEELFLDVRLDEYSSTDQSRAIYRITLATTTGYFELPNYMNGGVAGFLLDKDPDALCDDYCEDQGAYIMESRYKRQTDITPIPGDIQVVKNKGPLLTTALALFGQGSYIETRAKHPEIYSALVTYNNSAEDRPSNFYACRELVPLGHLVSNTPSSINDCILVSDGDRPDVRNQIADWLENFLAKPERLENAFNAAAFIATKKWLENPAGWVSSSADRRVSFDMGADTQVPVISRAGVIVGSVLLGINVLGVLVLGVYAAWSPRWTRVLDSFAMMRIGGAISRHVPLFMAYRLDLVKELRAQPGWMGDQMPESESVGMLGLGGPLLLRSGRKYVSYHKEPLH